MQGKLYVKKKMPWANVNVKVFIHLCLYDWNKSWQDIPIHVSTELALINSQLVLTYTT